MRRHVASLVLVVLLYPSWVSTQAQLAPVAAPVATPEEFFGFRMGADRELASWSEIRKYFEAIATVSDRVELVDAGPTTDGNRLVAAVISAPENIARLDAIRTANLRLADPRGIAPAEARSIAEKNPVVVAIGASIHASEIGATQAANELLHSLATASDAETLQVLRDVVLVLLPSLNPDGHMLVVDWYRKWRGTDFEGSPLPWLYHRYVGHDINRDAFMMNMVENRSLARFFYRQWHPQVFLTMHQMGPRGPRFFVPPNYDPIDANYDPIIWRTAGLLGHAMALTLEEDGRSGVVQNALYDYYWPGYEDSAPLGHNTVCVLTEVASVRVATPIRVAANELQGSPRGLPEYRAQINFPNPWPGGEWKLRDIVDYDLSAVRGLLEGAARYRSTLLENFYRMGLRAVETGAKGGPFAFIISPDQYDPHAANKLRQLLLDGAVDMQRSLEPFRVADTVYPAGTDIILMAQPFRAYAKTLLERQVYPARRTAPGAPPERPYDVAGWTLPWQMNVKIDRYDQTFEPPPTTRLDLTAIAPAQVWGDRRADYFVIDGRGNGASIAINRLMKAGAQVSWTTRPVELQGFTYAPGAIVARATSDLRAVLDGVANELGLRVTGARGRAPEGQLALARSRVGLYKPWVENIDEGWTRWLLEQFEFSYETLTDQDIRRGGLRGRVDAIILPDQVAERLLQGHAQGTMPPEYVGGLGQEGVAALVQFVQSGGTLVALDSAADFAADALKLPVKNVVRDAKPEQFFCPGSLLRLELDPNQPLAFGMPAQTAAFFSFSGAYETDAGSTTGSVKTVGRYGSKDLLMSGWLEGEPMIAGKSAVLEAAVGEGRAVLLAFRAQHRAQAHATFRLLFNALHTSASALPPSGRTTR
ncbi:MAG: M14 family metallopeptidase [Acidobacteria bacterium]|nr:M14 family metallopeptidase [Acidobacteriota bacterium]